MPAKGRLMFFISAPCTDFSAASPGKKGMDGESAAVLLAALKFVKMSLAFKIRPFLVIIEQVPGIIKRVNGSSPPLTGILECLDEMKFKCVACRECDAAILGGRPMMRTREIIVASLNSKSLAADILYGSDDLDKCPGCAEGDECSRCHFKKVDERSSDASVVYTTVMHNGITAPNVNVVRTATASDGRTLVVAPGGVVGVLGVSQILKLFGYPPCLLDDVSCPTQKSRFIGNSISLDLLLFLFHRVEACVYAEEHENSVETLLEERALCINERGCDIIIPAFGFNASSNKYRMSKELESLPSNIICVRDEGVFLIKDVFSSTPSRVRYFSLVEFFDFKVDLESIEISDIRAYLHRLFCHGVIVEPEMLTRLHLWAESRGERLFPPPSQFFLKNKALVHDAGYLKIRNLLGDTHYWPVEVFRYSPTLWKCRKVPTTKLKPGQLYAILVPLAKNGTSSKAKYLLGLDKKYSVYFIVDEGEVLLIGTTAGMRAFIETRNFCTASTHEDAALALRLLEDAQNHISDIDSIRRGCEDMSVNIGTVLRLRSLAGRLDKASERRNIVEQRQRTAAILGIPGAQISLLEQKAVGLKLNFIWKGVEKAGIIVGYEEETRKTEIKLNNGETEAFNLADHNADVRKISHMRKNDFKKEFVVPRDLSCRKKANSEPSTFCAPSFDPDIPGENDKIDIVDRIAGQDLTGCGPLIEERGSRKVVKWKCTEYERPDCITRPIGLYKSKENRWIGDFLNKFSWNLNKCATGLYRELILHFDKGVLLELDLSFAAPFGSPEDVKALMPTVARDIRNRKRFPQEADISLFHALSVKEKKRRRKKFLELIFLSDGTLPPVAMPGSIVSLRVLVDGIEKDIVTEMPNWQSRLEKRQQSLDLNEFSSDSDDGDISQPTKPRVKKARLLDSASPAAGTIGSHFVTATPSTGRGRGRPKGSLNKRKPAALMDILEKPSKKAKTAYDSPSTTSTRLPATILGKSIWDRPKKFLLESTVAAVGMIISSAVERWR